MIHFLLTVTKKQLVLLRIYSTGCLKPTITMSRCQKQKGGNDCGLFAIANATAIAFGKNPTSYNLFKHPLGHIWLIA